MGLRRMGSVLLLGVLVVSWVPQSVYGIAIIGTDGRFVEATPPVTQVLSPSDTGQFMDTVFNADAIAGASQDTTIGVLGMSGIGSAGLGNTRDAFFDARSVFLSRFTLLEAHNYTLTGELFEDFASGSGGTSVTLIDTDTFMTAIPSIVGPASFNSSGMLMAGNYQLSVNAFADAQENSPTNFSGSGFSSYDFNFTLIEKPTAPGVPEPITATLGLMGLGVLGMATRRRAA